MKESIVQKIELDIPQSSIKFHFDFEDQVAYAKEALKLAKQQTEGTLMYGSFEEDRWKFENHLSPGSGFIFSFNEIRERLHFHALGNEEDIILILKCWVCDLVCDYHPHTVRSMFGMLQEALIKTQGFRVEKLEMFIEFLHQDERTHDQIGRLIITTLSFLDFSGISTEREYIRPLLDVKAKLKIEEKVRELPSSRDILRFSWTIESFFKDVIKEGAAFEQRLYYAPLLLWWKLTTVIPIRASEFCLISRDCLKVDGNRFFIQLPRKKKRKKALQVVDTLEINKSLHDLIHQYILETDRFGFTKTLISYRSFIQVEGSVGRVNKINPDYFTLPILAYILRSFYRTYVLIEHGDQIRRWLRPNDTRHLAFCSLMMQGISPVEIARLGGHESLDAQYHYSQHTEYFIDSEIHNLMKGYVLEDQAGIESVQQLPYSLIERILKKPKSDVRLPLDFGVCTDEEQRCESSECIYCPHWWVSPTNLMERQDEMIAWIQAKRNHIHEIAGFLTRLHQSFDLNELGHVHPQSFTSMKTKAQEIKEQLKQLAWLQMLNGGIEHARKETRT